MSLYVPRADEGDASSSARTRDDIGVCWQFIEHRQEAPVPPPGTLCMQGTAGIAAFMLLLARVLADGHDAPVVDYPDRRWAVPAHLRRSGIDGCSTYATRPSWEPLNCR